MDPGSSLRLMVKGEKMSGKEFTKTVMLTVGTEATAEERLTGVGIETRVEEDKVFIDNVVFASAAEKAGLDFDQEIMNIQIPTKRLPKELMYIPALLLYGLICLLQLRRRKKQVAPA
jgi:C-terminal processing protease CtpA/Prc